MSISTTKLEARKKSSQLVDRIWTIQDRISELVEFEKQWDEIFALLRAKAGQDRRVNILNSGVYRSFRWDRYQVVLSDLLSLLENEMPATLELAQEVRDIRDEFNLKYSDATALQSSYLDEKPSLEKIDEITGKVFEIVSDNSAWIGRPESARSDFSHVSSVSDQIDLILFGSIRYAIEKLYQHADEADAYWMAREKYFASDAAPRDFVELECGERINGYKVSGLLRPPLTPADSPWAHSRSAAFAGIRFTTPPRTGDGAIGSTRRIGGTFEIGVFAIGHAASSE